MDGAGTEQIVTDQEAAPPWRALLGSPDPVDAPRPVPTLTSMLAVGGGLLAAAGLFFLLAELDGYDQRFVGLAISVIFLVLGVAISTVNRSSRAAAAGVAISALSVVPMTVFLWANADLFGTFSGGDATDANPYDGVRGVITIMLLTAAVVWLAGYLLGPGRRFGIYLGAALVALWLIPMFHLQVSAWEDTFSTFSSSTFEPVPDSGFDSGFDSSFDSGSDLESQFDEDFTFEEPEISDPTTKMGVFSLAFGAVYLAFAGWRDRRGDVRMATAALAPAILILLAAASSLTGHIGWVGSGLLGMAIGGALLAVGLRRGRRASSWIGVLVATIGLGSLVVEGLGESPRAIGVVLAVLGVAIALLVGRTAPGPATDGAPPAAPLDAPPDPVDPMATFGYPIPPSPPVSTAPWDRPAAPPTSPPTSSPWAQPPAPPTGPPSGPPGSQPF